MGSIHFSPFTSQFENGASGTVVLGSPGSGKTYFMLNVAANCIMYEQKIFAIDFKNDMMKLKNIMPNIEIIDINNVKPGSLNPFRVLKKIDTSIILALISIMVGDLTSEQKTAITPIIEDFVKAHNRTNASVTFADIANHLYSREDINSQNIGNTLRIHANTKYGKLVFGELEEEDDIVSMTNKSKIISLFGMDLPQYNEKPTEAQVFNSSVIFIICTMLQELLLNSKKYPTLFILDEAHIAFRNTSFTNIINQFLSLGRSRNVATMLGTQNATHIPESLTSMISSKFTFRTSVSETKKFLELFSPDSSDSQMNNQYIIDKVSNFKDGDVFYIDSKNRSGMFKVTSQFGDSISSNPLL